METEQIRIPRTQKERILGALEQAGELGVSNIELNRIAYRYSARLHDLKREGYTILAKHVKGAIWRFILIP